MHDRPRLMDHHVFAAPPPPGVDVPAPGPTPPRLAGMIENNVLVGEDGTLFLAGGAHAVLDIVTGRRAIPEPSFGVFADNIATRAAWARDHSAAYLHVLFPDKQSVVPERWPIGTPLQVGALYLERCRDKHLPIFYPVQLLARHRDETISTIDTHVTAYGSILVAGEVVRRLTSEPQEPMIDRLLATLDSEVERTGDLGAKLTPPVAAIERISSAPPPGRWLNNAIRGGNNGLVDLRFCPNPVYDKRLVMFGDSFGRDVAHFLQFWFRETLFFRSEFFDPDLAALCRPDLLVTENVERYLDICRPDDERPCFFMYPHLGGAPYAPSEEFARAFSAMLGVPRLPYRAFHAAEFGRQPSEPPRSVSHLPASFRSGRLRLAERAADMDERTVIEPPETVPRRMPAFRLDQSGRQLHDLLAATQDIHGSGLVRRRDVLLLGANLQVDADGRWACESRMFGQQFLDQMATGWFRAAFPGPKPAIRTEEGANLLDFDALPAQLIETVAEPVFLATPLEPMSWARWIVTVLPKLVRFRLFGRGRRLFCYAEMQWQRDLLAQFGLADSEILSHDPGRTYFCADIMTTDYSIANLTVSRQERSLFAELRERLAPAVTAFGASPCAERIFVPRNGPWARHRNDPVLQNEADLAAALGRLGLVTFAPDSLHIGQQAAVLARARMVVFLGGSALYGAVFCDRGTKVVTIEPGDALLRPHCDLLSSLGLAHGVVVGRQTEAAVTPGPVRWAVDVPAICEAVEDFAGR